MKELKPNPVDGPALSDEVYALALARIDAVMGCTEDSAGGGRACPLGRDRRRARTNVRDRHRRHCGPRRPPAGG